MGNKLSTVEQVSDTTLLCKFRKLLNDHDLHKKFLDKSQKLLGKGDLRHLAERWALPFWKQQTLTKDGIRSVTRECVLRKRISRIISGCVYVSEQAHITAFAQTRSIAANETEGKVAPGLVCEDDAVVYGDIGYLKMEK